MQSGNMERNIQKTVAGCEKMSSILKMDLHWELIVEIYFIFS